MTTGRQSSLEFRQMALQQQLVQAEIAYRLLEHHLSESRQGSIPHIRAKMNEWESTIKWCHQELANVEAEYDRITQSASR